MKLTSKIISLILALSMILSASAFALDFPDVTSDNKNAEAIDVLSSLGIIRGYDDGQYKPEKEVTRAEMTSLLLRVLALSVISSTPVETIFTDVDPSNWAAQDIKTATERGIVNGYGGRLFGPDDNVTLEQAVKMVVEALGYGHDIALGEGDNWAVNYMGQARNLELLDNITTGQKENAPRGVIAQLLYNSLEVDLMKPVTGSEDKYKVYEGQNFLTDNLKIRKIEGMIVANPSTALSGTTSAVLADEIVLKVGTEEIRLKVNGFTEAQNMLGMNVVVYEKDDDANENRVIQHIMNKSAVTTLTIADEDIVSVNNDVVTYYKDGNEMREYTAKIATNPVLIYNGKNYDYATAKSENILKPEIGSIKLTDSGNGYDLIEIESYENIVVSTVDSSNYKVLSVSPAAYKSNGFSIPVDDVDYAITITKDGSEATFSSIRKDQILTVKKSKGVETPILIDVKISDKTVSGQISAVNDDVYTINNTEYKISPSLKADASLKTDVLDKIVFGASGKFYLDAFGKIAYADFTSSNVASNYTYAYMIDAQESQKADGAVKMEVVTSSGSDVLTLADKCTVDNTPLSDSTAILNALQAAADKTNYDLVAAGKTVGKSQLIRYQKNSSGLVNEIGTINGSIKSELAYANYIATGATYTSGTMTFKYDTDTSVQINKSTKVFKVPVEDRTKDDFYSVQTGTSGLYNTKKYRIETYDKSTSGVAAYAVIYVDTVADPLVYNSPTFVISEINEVMVDGVVKFQLTGYTLTTGNETKLVLENNADEANLSIGDVIRYTTNAKGEISTATLYKYVDVSDAIAGTAPAKPDVTTDFEATKTPLREVYMGSSLSSPYFDYGTTYYGINKVDAAGSSGYGFVYTTPVSKLLVEDAKNITLSTATPTEADFYTDNTKTAVNSVNTEQLSFGEAEIKIPVIIYDASKTGTNVLEVVSKDSREAALQSIRTYEEYKDSVTDTVDPTDKVFVIICNNIARGVYIIKK